VHRVLTLIGVALVVAGLVFSFFPLVPGPSQELTPTQPEAIFNATTPISLTGGWNIGVSWSSNHLVSLLIVVCHSINLNAPTLQTVCPGAALSVLNGTSGSDTYSVPLGGALLVGIVSNLSSGLRVHVQLTPALTLVGLLFVIGGAGVVVVGVWPRPKTRGSSLPSSGTRP